MAQITYLKNGNVIYNDKETEFYNLPRPLLFQIFEEDTGIKNIPGDKLRVLEMFFDYAERNGYPFPAIPPKEVFLRHEAEHTYYKYGKRFERIITKKRGDRAEDNAVLLRFHDFVKEHKLMSEREWERNVKDWRETLQNETITETVWECEPLKDEKGKLVIDQANQAEQDKTNELIRNFYKWLSKHVKG